MYLGKVVERANVVSLFRAAKHPYTRALLRSIPTIEKERRHRLDTIEGMVPDPYNVPSGCPFHPRCPDFMPGICDVIEPPTYRTADGHQVRCLLYDESIQVKTAAGATQEAA